MSDQGTVSIVAARYVASAVRQDQYPVEELCEFAFIGRSNVGKSSLLNSLSRRHGLARISGTPGKTQTLNFYFLTAKMEEERKDFFLVDLPGYGYARTGQSNRKQWAKFTEEYLLKSPRLKLIFQLIDIRHPPMASDIAVYKWLVENNLPVMIIATKADKISRMATVKHAGLIKKGLNMRSTDRLLPYSSAKGTGREELLDVIGEILLK